MNTASLVMALTFMALASLVLLIELEEKRRDHQILWLRRTFLLAMAGAVINYLIALVESAK